MTDLEPPRPLGPHGMRFWHAVQAETPIEDAGGVELLMQACAAVDRAEQLAAAIAERGAVVRGKLNPLVRQELSIRKFVVTTL
jgi:hypothetical protein